MDGFTLIEVLLSVSILVFGIILIYQSFFIILDTYNYYIHYLDVSHLISEKVWQIKDEISKNGPSLLVEKEGSFSKNNKEYRWNLALNMLASDLYQIDLTFFWKEGKRNIRLNRRAYALYKKRD